MFAYYNFKYARYQTFTNLQKIVMLKIVENDSISMTPSFSCAVSYFRYSLVCASFGLSCARKCKIKPRTKVITSFFKSH